MDTEFLAFLGLMLTVFISTARQKLVVLFGILTLQCNMSDSNEIQTSVLGVLDFSEPVSLNYSFA